MPRLVHQPARFVWYLSGSRAPKDYKQFSTCICIKSNPVSCIDPKFQLKRSYHSAMSTTLAPTVTAPPANGAELKRLQFVPEAAEKAACTAEKLYTTGKAYVPASMKPKLDQVEERVSSLSAPYVSKAQDSSAELLKAVDQKVDKAVGQASALYQSNTTYLQEQLEKQKQFHAANLESYRAAREQYLKKVEDSVDYLKEHGLTGAAKAAFDEVSSRLAEAKKLPSYLLHQVQEAFDKLLAFSPVHKLMEAARPQLDAAYTTYSKLHDNVVGSPRYRQTYDYTLQVLDRLQATALYQTAKMRLYPIVQPYADPAFNAVVSSPYYQKAVEHVKPVHVA